MNAVESMLAELCPSGVEFRPLGDIAKLVRGSGLPKSDFAEDGVGCIHYGQVYTHYGTWATETISFVPPEKAAKLAKVDPGDLIVTNTSENLQDVCKAVAWLGADQVVTGGHATVVKHQMDPKFLAYCFQARGFGAQRDRLATGTKVYDVSAKKLAGARIPVPPLRVQRAIAELLDTFSELDRQLAIELGAELDQRRRQLQYHRQNSLTSNTGDIAWSTLGEVSLKVSSGGTPSRSRPDYFGGDIPWLRTQEVQFADVTETELTITEAGLKNSSAKWVPADSVIIAMYGATAAKAAVNRIPLTTNQACCNLQIDPAKADYRYVYHWVRAEYDRLRSLGEGSQSNLNASKVKNYPIALPPLDEQRRLARLLDDLDQSMEDIVAALSSEQVARRKQYEYYRDRLLAFDEAAA